MAFVTGGTGFIGQHLIRELLAHGYGVTALVRTFERARQLPAGVRIVPGDITKPDSLRPGLRGADVVFHAAGLHGTGVKPRDYARLQRINVDGTRHVLELAAELGVPKIVYVSTVAVYGDTGGQVVDETYHGNGQPLSDAYQRSKQQAHYAVAVPLQGRGLPLVIACPGKTYGPGDLSRIGQMLRQHVRRRLFVLAGPDSARSWTYVEDVAAGLRRAAEQGRAGQTYNLAGPAQTFREFFTACSRVSGAPAPLVWLSSSLAHLLAQALTRPLPALAEQLRAVAGTTYLASAAKAKHELGWRARPLAEGLPPTIAGLKEN